MYKTVLYSLLLVLLLTNCDGRKTRSKALKECVEQFKSTTAIAFANYYPENYNEIITDTVFNNGFKVQLKTFTNMEKSFSHISVSNGVQFETLYRQFESELFIKYKDEFIFKNILNKKLLNTYLYHKIDDNYILKGTWINEELSTFTEAVVIYMEYCKINSDNCKLFNIGVSKDGQLKVLLLKEFIL